MRLRFTTFFTALLLEASVSSFATSPASQHKKLHAATDSISTSHHRIPFVVPRGGVDTQLFATSTTTSQPAVSESNLQVLSERGRTALQKLVESDPDGHQAHVYGDWPEAGVEDQGKKRLAEQVRVCVGI